LRFDDPAYIHNNNSQKLTPNTHCGNPEITFLYKAPGFSSNRNDVRVKTQCKPAFALKLQCRLHAVYALGVKQHEPHLWLALTMGNGRQAEKNSTNVKLVILPKTFINE